MNVDLKNGATDGVIRVADTVHRPRGQWSDAVEALLVHLEKAGFPFSPRFLGHDAEGRQVLSYIAGEAGNYPASASVWSDSALAGVGRVLRSFHDCTLSFDWNRFDAWNQTCPDFVDTEVVCHNDFATYNCIYSNGVPMGMIDFDTCGPGSRAWDLAYTAFRCMPIGTPQQQKTFGVPSPVRLDRRLELLLEAYNFEDTQGILGLISLRIQQIRDQAALLAQGIDRNARRIREEKHVESYDEALEYFRRQFGRRRT